VANCTNCDRATNPFGTSRKSLRQVPHDGVPNIILKNMPRRVFVYLIYVYNSCIKLCYFPKIWKHGSVIPIPKPDKIHSNPSNYRLIMSSISKVFEWIIPKRLNGFISPVNILPDHQFGFRVVYSTSHQLRRVVRHVKTKRSLRVPESTGMLLLDVEKAFDSVWHEALLHKLLVNGCGPTYFFIS
jgi:hypothetical protein